jgi:hypothetical protein
VKRPASLFFGYEGSGVVGRGQRADVRVARPVGVVGVVRVVGVRVRVTRRE